MSASQARYLLGDLLQVQGEVWRDGRVGCAPAEDPRGRRDKPGTGLRCERPSHPKGRVANKLLAVAAKNGNARCEAEGGGSCLYGACGEPVSGVPGLDDRPLDGALHEQPAGRCPVARGDEGRGRRAPAARLPQDPHHAGPPWHRDEFIGCATIAGVSLTAPARNPSRDSPANSRAGSSAGRACRCGGGR